ncbi:MAG: aminoacyl-tRNA hydrolase [Calditrichia bacterium]|nr:aminoacyl-tRNA hydrolase [Calditrichia bacterium]
MHVIIGLGNPGEKYEKTRHNVGFLVVDHINSRFNGSFSKGRGPYLQSKISLDSTPVLLVKPTTYMNLSGQAVRHIIEYYKTDLANEILVVVDDFHLPFGSIRIKPNGSAGGQNGLKSIIQVTSSNQFHRLRFGIGSKHSILSGDMSGFVLSAFNRSERDHLAEMVEWAADATVSFVTSGPEATMNKYNRNYLEDSN